MKNPGLPNQIIWLALTSPSKEDRTQDIDDVDKNNLCYFLGRKNYRFFGQVNCVFSRTENPIEGRRKDCVFFSDEKFKRSMLKKKNINKILGHVEDIQKQQIN